MTYQYRVRDPLGNLVEGRIEAVSPDDAGQRLRRDGFQIVKIEETTHAAQGDDQPGLFGGRVSQREIIYTTGQLAVMVDTGITLPVAIGGIIDQEQNPGLRRLLTEIKRSVEGGEDFSAALAKHPKQFDKIYVSLVRASEKTGTLGEMLDRIANYLRNRLDNRSKIRAAMAYPTVMLVMAIGVTIFLLAYVFPKFTPLFTRKGITLPKPTQVMLAISQSLTGYWYLYLAGVIALILGFVFGRRTERGRQAWDWVKINTPILGTLFRKVAISRSLRTLGTMIASGVSVLEALRMSAEVSANHYYETLWYRVVDEVTTGRQICDALHGTTLLPPTLVQMIAAGEQTGKLDVVLEKISTYYDREVETALKTATSLIEPIMICIMGVIVGGIGMALLLPIFTLSRSHG